MVGGVGLKVPAKPNQKLVKIDDTVLVLVESTHRARDVVGRPSKIGAELRKASDVDMTALFRIVTLEVLHSLLNDRIVGCF